MDTLTSEEVNVIYRALMMYRNRAVSQKDSDIADGVIEKIVEKPVVHIEARVI